MAAYTDFLDGVQTKATQLAGISIFQNDKTGYDLKNIEATAKVYAGLTATEIDYYPQKGLYTAISYAFTDLILLASMLLLALILVRQERDSGLLSLVRSLPGGRLKTALAKLAAFAASLLVVLTVLYGVNLAYCSASFGLGSLNRTIQSVPALMRCTMQITVGQYLLRFLLAKWAGAFVMGLWVMLAALVAKRAAAGWVGALALPLAMYGIRAAIPATSHWNVIKYANMVSLLQTNELLGNYRNLFWFGSPVSLPLVEWLTAAVLGSSLFAGFCAVFAKAQLLPTAKRSLTLPFSHTTRATSVPREEGRKLLLMNGAAVFLAAFLAFGIYQGVTSESYLDADEIYYAYYMRHISGPWRAESYNWLIEQGKEFAPMLAPAMSISELQAVPKFITLSDLLIFWFICRFAACLCMSRITLWLGQKLGNLLPALFISAVAYCLPALLSLSGMKNGIEWLGFYPLFHAAALWQTQGGNTLWVPIFLSCAAFLLAWGFGQALMDEYDMLGVPDEVL